MKRNILMFVCVICCLILISLSYQPIIADDINNSKIDIKHKEFILGILENPVIMNDTYFYMETKILFRIEWLRIPFQYLNFGLSVYWTGMSISKSIGGGKFTFRGIITDNFICGILSW
jgi:hypothetical protein